jgi:hypothetical protein
MATRADIYNLACDRAIETAITTVLGTDTSSTAGLGEGAKPASINRKEALRFLVRRLMLKERNNKTRVIVANSVNGEATS